MIKKLNINKKAIGKSKQGFTLVELIISFALLATVALCVGMMMSTGTNLYLRVNKRISLSYAQQAMVQIEQYFDDCNGICQENGVTYFTKPVEAGGTPMLYSFRFSEDESTLYLDEYEVIEGVISAEPESQPLSTKISAFNISYAKTSGNRLTGITIDLTATVEGSSYSKKKLVTFRADPICIEEAEDGTFKDSLVSQVWREE